MSLDKSFEIQSSDKAIGSSSCKQIISVVILKANIPTHSVQKFNERFIPSHKIMQWMVPSLFQNIIRMFWFESSFGWKFLFVESYLQDSCRFIIMATIASKCKLNARPIKDKYSALKEGEDGKTKSQVAAKYGIPKNTWSTWLKIKDKVFEATKNGSNSKRQWLRWGTFANLDETMFK